MWFSHGEPPKNTHWVPLFLLFFGLQFLLFWVLSKWSPSISFATGPASLSSRLTALNLSTPWSAANSADSVGQFRRATLVQAEEAYQKNLAKRESAMFMASGTDDDSKTFYIRPLYPCPLEERIGGWPDGGKWMCLLPSYASKESMVVYSIGCNGQTSFEYDIWQMYKTKPFVFDPTLPPEALSSVQKMEFLTFFNIGLTGADNASEAMSHMSSIAPGAQMMQIEQIMAMLGHGFVDVFKIDCEGCEMEVFRRLSQTRLREKPLFGQILVEIHEYPTFVRQFHLLEMIESLGYRMFHAEPNFYYSLGFELGYIHESLVGV